MSIQTQIDRLASAKAAIKTAIEGKKVAVPEDTLLSEMAALIEGIEADNSTLLGHEFKCGTITPAEDITYNYVIEFDDIFKTNSNTSSDPFHFFLYRQNADGGTAPNNSWVWLVMGRKAYNSGYVFGQYTSNTGSLLDANYGGVVGNLSYSDKVRIHCTTSKKLVAGQTYNWMAINSL